jgi:hypothetical protein
VYDGGVDTKQRDPRVLYFSLLAAALVGGLAGYLLERFAPTNELAPRHAAATTPLALAVTSPGAEMLLAVATLIMLAWGVTLVAFWYFWRIPGAGLIARTHPVVRSSWTLFSMLAALGLLGVLTFAHQLVGAMHPLFRVKRQSMHDRAPSLAPGAGRPE